MWKHRFGDCGCGKTHLDPNGASVVPLQGARRTYFNYRKSDGSTSYRVVRIDLPVGGKRFAIEHWTADSWVRGLDGCEPLLYRLPELLEDLAQRPDRWVLIPEGEGKADLLARHGLTATAHHGGAGGPWLAAWNEILRGARVAVLPDNDLPGRKHAERIATELQGFAAEVRVVLIPGLSPGDDVANWMHAGGSADELLRLVDAVPAWSPAPASRRGEEMLTCDMATATASLSQVAWLWKPWLPRGFVTCLAAVDGFGKSKLALHIMRCAITQLPMWPDGTPATAPSNPRTALLYLPTEAQQGLDRERMAAVDMLEHVHVINHRLIPRFAQDDIADLTLEDEEVRELVRRIVLERRPLLFVVDSLYGAHLRDENSSREMSETMKFLRDLARDADTVVLVTQLARKAREGEGFGLLTLDRIRGSTAIRQSCRSIIGIEQPNAECPDEYRVRQIKNNVTRLGDPLGMRHVSDAELTFGPPPAEPVHQTATDRAAEALRRYLEEHGPSPMKDVRTALEAQGHSGSAITRAKKALAIVATATGRSGGGVECWIWSMPGQHGRLDWSTEPESDTDEGEGGDTT